MLLHEFIDTTNLTASEATWIVQIKGELRRYHGPSFDLDVMREAFSKVLEGYLSDYRAKGIEWGAAWLGTMRGWPSWEDRGQRAAAPASPSLRYLTDVDEGSRLFLLDGRKLVIIKEGDAVEVIDLETAELEVMVPEVAR